MALAAGGAAADGGAGGGGARWVPEPQSVGLWQQRSGVSLYKCLVVYPVPVTALEGSKWANTCEGRGGVLVTLCVPIHLRASNPRLNVSIRQIV